MKVQTAQSPSRVPLWRPGRGVPTLPKPCPKPKTPAQHRPIISGNALIVLFSFWLSASVSAMDRWAALSMLESGNNDNATGPDGEVSRFQIQRTLWPGGDPHDPKTALVAAQGIMGPRLEKFEQDCKRQPTDFEFYVLWNAPAKIKHPSVPVAERANRFANLVEGGQPPSPSTHSTAKVVAGH
jgi:hypothetical protein